MAFLRLSPRPRNAYPRRRYYRSSVQYGTGNNCGRQALIGTQLVPDRVEAIFFIPESALPPDKLR